MIQKILIHLLVLCCLAIPSLAQERIVPHVTPPQAAIQTHIQLTNNTDTAIEYQLKPYTAEGVALAPQQGEVAANSQISAPAADFFDGDVGYFILDAEASLELSQQYILGTAGEELEVEIITEDAASWTMDNIGTHAYFAVVNLGDHATPVWLHQRDESGRIVASSRLADALDPGARLLHDVSATAFVEDECFTYELTADQYLAPLCLSVGGESTLTVNPLHDKRKAESMRDDAGIWFITDGSLSDVFEMMGYNVASDRLWQGELLRRTGTGRLSEIFGPDFISQDTSVLTTGYSQEEYDAAFAGLSEEEQTVISSYVAGFNRRIAELREDPALVPFEFFALGITHIEDWTVNQVLAWAVALQHNFSFGYGASYQISYLSELQGLMERFGPALGTMMFLDLHWTNDPHALSMIPADGTVNKVAKKPPVLPVPKKGLPDVRELARQLDARQEANRSALKEIGAFIKGGSYAWVVSGDKTASGNPILYSGPQLDDPADFQAPGLVQEGSIRGGGLDVAGLIVTGIPAIIVGRTPHHAWSFQVGHATDQDLYFEQPQNIISQRTETIPVAGSDPVTITIAATARGQVVNADPLLVHKSATRHYEFGFVKATLGLAKATSMDEFGEAVADLAVSMHICYADVDKNIAYWHSGRQPVRPHGNWMLPQGALGTPLEWDAAVIEPLAHDRNHPQGFYGGWNNKASATIEEPAAMLRFSRMHIAHVITDYLSAHDNLTFDDVANLAVRIATTNGTIMGAGNTWSFMGEFFRPVVEANATPDRLAALEIIENWNGQAVSGSPEEWYANMDYQDGFVLQDVWLNKVVTKTFSDELPGTDNLFGSRLKTMLHLLDPDRGLEKSYDWFRNDNGGVSGFENIVLSALDETLAELGPCSLGDWRPSAHDFQPSAIW